MRIKLFQMLPALESHDTSSFDEGWKDAIYALVENGPMAIEEIGGEEAVSGLRNDGHVVDVFVSDGSWKPAATKKGIELYCQIVGADTVEQAIAKRKKWLAEDSVQAEEALVHAESKADDEAEDAVNTRSKAEEIKEIATESFTNLNGEVV